MRLPRPHVPLAVRVQVAERQVVAARPTTSFHDVPARPSSARLATLLEKLAGQIGCRVEELRLDHDPALGARQKVMDGDRVVEYDPPANDPEHLRYRPHGPEHDGSHLIKTNVRGDGAQFPDRVLIKRQRRRERLEVDKLQGRLRVGMKVTGSMRGKIVGVGRWPKRKLRSANRWPKRRAK